MEASWSRIRSAATYLTVGPTRFPVRWTASDWGGAAVGVSVARGRVGPNGTNAVPPLNKHATLGFVPKRPAVARWGPYGGQRRLGAEL
jgi:hypothetical protein